MVLIRARTKVISLVENVFIFVYFFFFTRNLFITYLIYYYTFLFNLISFACKDGILLRAKFRKFCIAVLSMNVQYFNIFRT